MLYEKGNKKPTSAEVGFLINAKIKVITKNP
jgi:hypothetical protein